LLVLNGGGSSMPSLSGLGSGLSGKGVQHLKKHLLNAKRGIGRTKVFKKTSIRRKQVMERNQKPSL